MGGLAMWRAEAALRGLLRWTKCRSMIARAGGRMAPTVPLWSKLYLNGGALAKRLGLESTRLMPCIFGSAAPRHDAGQAVRRDTDPYYKASARSHQAKTVLGRVPVHLPIPSKPGAQAQPS